MKALIAKLLHDLPYKVLALALGVGLAVSVYDRPTQEFMVEIGLSLTGLPADRIFVGELPPRLMLRLRGPESELLDVLRRSRELRAEVDLARARDGDLITFRPDDLEKLVGGREVQVIQVSPSSLRVRLAERLVKDVPVRPIFAGMPAPGHRVVPEKVRVRPEKVRVSGPREAVEALEVLETEPVALAGLDRPARFQQRLIRPRAEAISLDRDTVTVEVGVQQEIRRLTYENVAPAVRGCPAEHRCTALPGHVQVTLHAPFELAQGLPSEQPPGWAVVQVPPEAGPGTYRTPVLLPELGSGISATVHPPSVEILIRAPARAPEPAPPPAPGTRRGATRDAKP